MRWIHRFEIALGIWLIVSPWLLDYASVSPARWNSIVIGVGMALVGLWAMFGREEVPPAQ
jgi:hypothetical protein